MTTFKPPSRYTPRPLSRTSSQDSFARDPSEDPEEQFLAKSKQFAIPLSELGRNPVAEGPDTSGTSNRAMFAHPSSYQQRTSGPQGRVLVEATPSQSGDSQEDASGNLSEPVEATQIPDEPEIQVHPNTALDAGSNASGYESSEPTSSFGRLLDGIDEREPDAQPTQPSTQPPLSNLASDPRSLVSLVRPENQWRYQKYQPQQPKQIMPSILDHQSHSKGEHISSFGQETQPSHPVYSSAVSNPPYLARNSHYGWNRSTRLGSPVGNCMDIVPDSEPMCSDQRRAPLTTNQPAKIASATKYNNNVNDEEYQDATMGNFELGCAPEDGGDEMDEEEDIPLAVSSRKQVKGKAASKAVDQRKRKAPQKTVHTAPSTKENVKVR